MVKEYLYVKNWVKQTGKSAPNLTNGLKKIGNGSMQNGVYAIMKYTGDIKLIQGFVLGAASITVLHKGTRFIKETIETGKKIKREIEEVRITEGNYINEEECNHAKVLETE